MHSKSNTASSATDNTGHHHPRRHGIVKKLLAVAVGVSVLAGAAYITIGHAFPAGSAAHGGHGAMFASFDPATASKRIDALVSFALADIDGTAEQKARIAEIAKGALGDLLPLRAEHKAARAKALALLSAPTIDRAAIEQLRAAELALAETASKRLTQAIADAAETLQPAQRAQLAAKIAERMGQRG